MESERVELNLGNGKPPMCVLVIGMAGSGKTTFIHVKFSVYNSLQKLLATRKTSRKP